MSEKRLDLERIKAVFWASDPGPWHQKAEYFYVGDGDRAIGMAPNESDAAFIVMAHREIPDLVAEVERLRAENERLAAEVKKYHPLDREGVEAPGDRCHCTHEAGDSDCPVHPTCSDCGAPIPGIGLPQHGAGCAYE